MAQRNENLLARKRVDNDKFNNTITLLNYFDKISEMVWKFGLHAFDKFLCTICYERENERRFFVFSFLFSLFWSNQNADEYGRKVCGVDLEFTPKCHPGNSEEKQFGTVV